MKPVYLSSCFYFEVVLNNESYNFKEVSGISLETNIEEITEGGQNRFKHKVPTSQKYSDLVLKRGIVSENSKLNRWVYNTLNIGLEKPIETKSLEISLLNENGNKVMTWSFIDTWPISWNTASLNSINDEILIESISFSYKYFTTKVIQ